MEVEVGVRGWMICGGHIHPSWHARQLGSRLERERDQRERGGVRRAKRREVRREKREERLDSEEVLRRTNNQTARDRQQDREIDRRREGDADVLHGNGCSMACPSLASPNSRLRQTTQLLKEKEEGNEPLRRALRWCNWECCNY